MSTKQIIFAGEGMPLKKALDAALTCPEISILQVYTNTRQEQVIGRLCQHAGIPVEDINQLKKNNLEVNSIPTHDWFFCVNSTVVFPAELLNLPTSGALNMHPGRLPDYAGLHTHQWAIRNGETDFAATLHWMTEKIDTGPIAYIDHFSIKENETGISLFLKCLSVGADLVSHALATIASDQSLPRIPQDLTQRRLYLNDQVSNGFINWNWTAAQIERFVRAADYTPFQSPTYQPTLKTPSDNYIVQKSSVIDSACRHEPGTVLQITPNALEVQAGSSQSLMITQMKHPQSDSPVPNFLLPHLTEGQILTS